MARIVGFITYFKTSSRQGKPCSSKLQTWLEGLEEALGLAVPQGWNALSLGALVPKWDCVRLLFPLESLA